MFASSRLLNARLQTTKVSHLPSQTSSTKPRLITISLSKHAKYKIPSQIFKFFYESFYLLRKCMNSSHKCATLQSNAKASRFITSHTSISLLLAPIRNHAPRKPSLPRSLTSSITKERVFSLHSGYIYEQVLITSNLFFLPILSSQINQQQCPPM